MDNREASHTPERVRPGHDAVESAIREAVLRSPGILSRKVSRKVSERPGFLRPKLLG